MLFIVAAILYLANSFDLATCYYKDTSANCRRSPSSCVNYACDYVQHRFGHFDCNYNNKNYLEGLLKNCWAPDINICLNAAKDHDNQVSITSANCRRSPNSCFNYACDYVQNRFGHFDCNYNDKNYLEGLLKNCWAPDINICLNAAKDHDNQIPITPANCRRNENSDRCTDYACNEIKRRQGRDCTWKIKNWIRDSLKNCYIPDVYRCVEKIPSSFDDHRRTEISPSICRRNPDSCMPYACDKMNKDYGRSCTDLYFKDQLRNKLQRCNSASVDLCLVNAYYDIRG